MIWDNWLVGDVTGSIHKGSGVGGAHNVAVGVGVVVTVNVKVDVTVGAVRLCSVFVGKIIGGNVFVVGGGGEIVGESVKVGISFGRIDAVTVGEIVGPMVSVGSDVSVELGENVSICCLDVSVGAGKQPPNIIGIRNMDEIIMCLHSSCFIELCLLLIVTLFLSRFMIISTT
jgi:hypothetical protein